MSQVLNVWNPVQTEDLSDSGGVVHRPGLSVSPSCFVPMARLPWEPQRHLSFDPSAPLPAAQTEERSGWAGGLQALRERLREVQRGAARVGGPHLPLQPLLSLWLRS